MKIRRPALQAKLFSDTVNRAKLCPAHRNAVIQLLATLLHEVAQEQCRELATAEVSDEQDRR